MKNNLESTLQEILQKNIDAERGYRKAAENADSDGLKTFFEDKSRDRKIFNDYLKQEILLNFENLKEEGSFTGTLHRTWMDLKSVFSKNSDAAMLEEAIRGDKSAVEEYEEILKNTELPPKIADIIRTQLVNIKIDLNEVKSLEDLKKTI